VALLSRHRDSRVHGPSGVAGLSWGDGFEEFDLLLRQAIHLIDEPVDLAVGSIDLALENGLFLRCLGGELLVLRKVLVHQRHHRLVSGLVGLVRPLKRFPPTFSDRQSLPTLFQTRPVQQFFNHDSKVMGYFVDVFFLGDEVTVMGRSIA
jgi:hypothetical protein